MEKKLRLFNPLFGNYSSETGFELIFTFRLKNKEKGDKVHLEIQ